jgi:hypothetical protein
MNKHCHICLGIGWVCETIPTALGMMRWVACAGLGMPCCCNDGDEPDISEVVIEEHDATRH